MNYSPDPWSSWGLSLLVLESDIIWTDSSPAEVSVDISHSLCSGMLPGFVAIVRTIETIKLLDVKANRPK